MNARNYRKLTEEIGNYYRGGLPDLGKPSEKNGYRWCAGYVATANGQERWRENLGRDKIVAQYRAREMSDLWALHEDDVWQRAAVGGALPPIETLDIPPLNREQAKAEAWASAAEALAAPGKLAAGVNATLRTGGNADHLGPAISPAFRLVAVPLDTPEHEAASVAARAEAPPAEAPAAGGVGLHRQEQRRR